MRNKAASDKIWVGHIIAKVQKQLTILCNPFAYGLDFSRIRWEIGLKMERQWSALFFLYNNKHLV